MRKRWQGYFREKNPAMGTSSVHSTQLFCASQAICIEIRLVGVPTCGGENIESGLTRINAQEGWPTAKTGAIVMELALEIAEATTDDEHNVWPVICDILDEQEVQIVIGILA